MLVHLVDLLLVLLQDEVPLDLHGGGELPGGEGEVLGRDHELVDLGRVGDGALVDLLDSRHDLRLDLRTVLSNKLLHSVRLHSETIGPLNKEINILYP